jgi:hypothetical protein
MKIQHKPPFKPPFKPVFTPIRQNLSVPKFQMSRFLNKPVIASRQKISTRKPVNVPISSLLKNSDPFSYPISNPYTNPIENTINNITIPKHIASQNVFPIQNKLHVAPHPHPDQFHIIAYYINEHRAKIIIRRLDSGNGWGQNLKLHLYSLHSNLSVHEPNGEPKPEPEQEPAFEIIPIGSSSTNFKIFEYDTKVTLAKMNTDYFQKIPKKIIQTARSNKMYNILHYNSVMSFIELNPEYSYHFFDNNDCRNFITHHYSNHVLKAYDILIPGAYKADLFRYCYLYIHGGCYFDCKMILYKPLRDIIPPNNNYVFTEDMTPKCYYNAAMMMIPRDERLLQLIHQCCYYIHNRIYRNVPHDFLSITGPYILAEFFNHIKPHIFFKKRDGNVDNEYIYRKNSIHSDILIKKQFNGYYKLYKKLYNNLPRYGELYRNRRIYH